MAELADLRRVLLLGAAAALSWATVACLGPTPAPASPPRQSPTPSASPVGAPATETPRPAPVGGKLAVTPVATGLAFPTSLAFAPDGTLFFTERPRGGVWVLEEEGGEPERVATVKVVVSTETGLLGLALHPQYPQEPYLYVYYTTVGEKGAHNRVSRLRLEGRRSVEEVLLDAIPAAPIHNGGVLAFGPDGKLYVTTGDAALRPGAQDLEYLGGKVLRLNPDGSPPRDNPFPASPVFTYGHRNVFGLAFHPRTGTPVITENGPNRDDEVNVLKAGSNYGWPLVVGRAKDQRFVDPILTFTPNIAPTQAVFYTGGRLSPEAQGALLFGAWNTGAIYRVTLAAPAYESLDSWEVWLRPGVGGIVGLAQGPDGYLYFTTADAIYRVVEAVS